MGLGLELARYSWGMGMLGAVGMGVFPTVLLRQSEGIINAHPGLTSSTVHEHVWNTADLSTPLSPEDWHAYTEIALGGSVGLLVLGMIGVFWGTHKGYFRG